MKIKGMRKVGIAVFIGGLAVSFPLNANQASVLEALAFATMGANGLEHIGSAIRGYTSSSSAGSSSDDSGSARVSEEA